MCGSPRTEQVPEKNNALYVSVNIFSTLLPIENNRNVLDSDYLLRATRGARNPNLQVVITHASHVCSQHSFGLLLRMNGMHRTQSYHARFDLLSLVI